MLGQRIKELRNQANLTQQELAEGIISRTYLSLIEKNSVHPSTNVLKKLSVRLNCTLEDFTSSSEDKNLSLLEIKKEIKWAENHVLMNDFKKLNDFINKKYETLPGINEAEKGAINWVRASVYFHNKDYVNARLYVEKAIEIVKKMRDVTLYIRSLELLARIEYEVGNVMEAINHLTKANKITIVENIVNITRVSVLFYLGNYYSRVGEFYVAIKLCEEALELNTKLNTHHLALNIENTLGRSYQATKDNKQAEYHYRRAISYAELRPVSFDYVGSLSNLSMLLSSLGRINEAYEMITKCNKLLDEHEFEHPYAVNVRLHLADVMIEKGMYDEARSIIAEYIELDDSGYGDELMGDLETKLENYQGALSYYKDALNGNEHVYYFGRIAKKIANIYEILGDLKQSNEYYKKCINLYEDSLPYMV
ncbi:helix-turn-helix transcriptional regulator [Macrococcus capreoli]|uniref:helix-turn-helix transcriptional regulator n=1 Tax=Macrococcus capreoli TaxID=2982690 RepID=UPI0021D5F836|nr:helix-turn-helix transcriptional regulator [Macrococcus sp. TMW 2.2395]MCU7558597.1 helix-turn-helix transcriptional regulator [Macrococcus sp. TMW 2.2395]